jgi:hypothetical protein
MSSNSRSLAAGAVLALILSSCVFSSCRGPANVALPVFDWPVHDMNRPVPPVVAPAPEPHAPPSDAVVLFDGRDLSAWRAGNGGEAGWKLEDGYVEVVRGAGSIWTRQPFGDVQMHMEWASPDPPSGSGQGRGNSGVKLMGLYEIQVLDSYENRTYADGQAGSVYGLYPPLVNVSRPPGQWQTFDIIFRAPRFAPNGSLVRPARVTVLHNGVLVQDNVALSGPTGRQRAPYRAHDERLPMMLQDHGDPVRYRNIWVRELEPEP